MKKLTIAFALLVAAHVALAQTTTTTTTTKTTKTTTTTTGPANSISCIATGQELQPIPEARRGNDGVLRATLATISEQVRMTTGTYGDGKPVVCYPQWVREYRLLPFKPAAANELANPMPGPTLRAQVGDLVELTFLNQIDAAKFPNSDHGCDQTSTYTGTRTATSTNDEYPDCFALSTTTNMHFHGTHTNPRTTGDNVFLEVRPSPRDDANAPVVTPDSVKEPFDEFFRSCETKLTPNDTPKQWPWFWTDWPENLRKYEAGLTAKYYPDLEKKNRNLIRQGEWPQYFVGNYPYCYRLPKYTPTAWPPASQAAMSSPHTHGAGSAEMDEAQEPQRPLVMGQSPGTHWYHAHKHGSTTINVSNGMTGVFIIEGEYDNYIREQYKTYGGIAEKVIVINQLLVTPSMERGGGGGPGPHFSVNGRLQPKITMKGGEVQLWRIANSSARAGIYFHAPTGVSWKQTAFDGVQFADSNYQKSLNRTVLLAAGNRADLLVKAPMLPAGQKSATYDIVVENTVDPSDRTPVDPNSVQETLLTVVVNANGTDAPFMTTAPPQPPFLEDIADKEVKGTQELTFATTGKKPGPVAPNPAQHTINGIKFNGEVGVAIRLNNVEEWKVVNETYAPLISHPFHIHINPFQITEVFDPNATVTDPATNKQVKKYVFDVPAGTKLAPGQCALDSSKPGEWKVCDNPPLAPGEHRIWWDVFSIPSGASATTVDGTVIKDAKGNPIQVPGYFKMRSRFVDYSGWYVLHCHILAHEDRGMMTVVDVTPLQPPYSHH